MCHYFVFCLWARDLGSCLVSAPSSFADIQQARICCVFLCALPFLGSPFSSLAMLQVDKLRPGTAGDLPKIPLRSLLAELGLEHSS